VGTRLGTEWAHFKSRVEAAAGVDPERVYRDKLSGTFTREQRPGLAALLDYARPGDAIVVVGIDRLGRGLRASELAGLEVGDLYFSSVPVAAQPKCSVHVERTKTKAKRAGEGWIVGTPKSKRSRRSVPLPGWLAAKMADYLANIHPRAAEPDASLWPPTCHQHRCPVTYIGAPANGFYAGVCA
jgi:Resolvase, N terminal domain